MKKPKFIILIAGDSLLKKMSRQQIAGTQKTNPLYDKGIVNFIFNMCKGITSRTAIHLFTKPVYKAKAEQTADILNKVMEKSDVMRDQIAPSEIISLEKIGVSKKDGDKFIIVFPDIPHTVFCTLVLKSYLDANLATWIEEDLNKCIGWVHYHPLNSQATTYAPSKELSKYVHFIKHIYESTLKNSQLPSPIPGTNLSKPALW